MGNRVSRVPSLRPRVPAGAYGFGGAGSPRAAVVVAILCRIAYTMLALFRSVTQRSDERRATPWQTLMDRSLCRPRTTELELRDPKPLRLP